MGAANGTAAYFSSETIHPNQTQRKESFPKPSCGGSRQEAGSEAYPCGASPGSPLRAGLAGTAPTRRRHRTGGSGENFRGRRGTGCTEEHRGRNGERTGAHRNGAQRHPHGQDAGCNRDHTGAHRGGAHQHPLSTEHKTCAGRGTQASPDKPHPVQQNYRFYAKARINPSGHFGRRSAACLQKIRRPGPVCSSECPRGWLR